MMHGWHFWAWYVPFVLACYWFGRWLVNRPFFSRKDDYRPR
jgi:hypothetical protein